MKKVILSALFAPALLAGCTPEEAEDPNELEGAGAAAEPVIPLENFEDAQEDGAPGADPLASDLEGGETTGDVTPENTPADEGL